jgi:hypothetical protein
MLKSIKNFFRKRKIRKYSRAVPTGLLPLSEIATAHIVIDVEEQEWDTLKEDILTWGRNAGIKVSIYFFDFRKLGKNELLLTSINTTIIQKELNWFDMPSPAKVGMLFRENSDLFISLISNKEFPIEFVSKCAKARFKIGRYPFEGHAYDMIMAGSEVAELRSDSREIFAAITAFLKKIQ